MSYICTKVHMYFQKYESHRSIITLLSYKLQVYSSSSQVFRLFILHIFSQERKISNKRKKLLLKKSNSQLSRNFTKPTKYPGHLPYKKNRKASIDLHQQKNDSKQRSRSPQKTNAYTYNISRKKRFRGIYNQKWCRPENRRTRKSISPSVVAAADACGACDSHRSGAHACSFYFSRIAATLRSLDVALSIRRFFFAPSGLYARYTHLP